MTHNQRLRLPDHEAARNGLAFQKTGFSIARITWSRLFGSFFCLLLGNDHDDHAFAGLD